MQKEMSYGIKEKMVAEKLAALCLLLHFFYLSSFFFFTLFSSQDGHRPL